MTNLSARYRALFRSFSFRGKRRVGTIDPTKSSTEISIPAEPTGVKIHDFIGAWMKETLDPMKELGALIWE